MLAGGDHVTPPIWATDSRADPAYARSLRGRPHGGIGKHVSDGRAALEQGKSLEDHTSFDRAQITIAALVGKPAWGVRLGVGSFLTIEFGHPISGEFIHGEWHLWLYFCDWIFQQGSFQIATSSDDREYSQLQNVELGNVIQADITRPDLNIILNFSSGYQITTFADVEYPEDQQWLLYTPFGECLTVYPGEQCKYDPIPLPDRR